jgi:hypothetical protein
MTQDIQKITSAFSYNFEDNNELATLKSLFFKTFESLTLIILSKKKTPFSTLKRVGRPLCSVINLQDMHFDSSTLGT